MSLLSVVKGVEGRLTLPLSSAVAGSSDETALLLMELANQTGKALAARYPWQALRKEHSWNATAQEQQNSGLPSDYGRHVPDTFFNRTRKRRVIGPLPPDAWNYQKSVTAQAIYDVFIIRGNTLRLMPVPALDDLYAYEYVSKHWVSGQVSSDAYLADTDTALIDEELIKLGTLWRYKRGKGLDYAEDFAEFEREVAKAMTADGGGGAILNMAGVSDPFAPRIPGTPEGSWLT